MEGQLCLDKKEARMTIAREISHRIKYELGVTVSIGISWNKIYAKLGSDYKKPDGFPFSWATGKFVEHISQYGDGSCV